jgi:hypothetical protein
VLCLCITFISFVLQCLGIADDKILSPAEQDYMLMEYNGMVKYVVCYLFPFLLVCLLFVYVLFVCVLCFVCLVILAFNLMLVINLVLGAVLNLSFKFTSTS